MYREIHTWVDVHLVFIKVILPIWTKSFSNPFPPYRGIRIYTFFSYFVIKIDDKLPDCSPGVCLTYKASTNQLRINMNEANVFESNSYTIKYQGSLVHCSVEIISEELIVMLRAFLPFAGSLWHKDK